MNPEQLIFDSVEDLDKHIKEEGNLKVFEQNSEMWIVYSLGRIYVEFYPAMIRNFESLLWYGKIKNYDKSKLKKIRS